MKDAIGSIGIILLLWGFFRVWPYDWRGRRKHIKIRSRRNDWDD